MFLNKHKHHHLYSNTCGIQTHVTICVTPKTVTVCEWIPHPSLVCETWGTPNVSLHSCVCVCLLYSFVCAWLLVLFTCDTLTVTFLSFDCRSMDTSSIFNVQRHLYLILNMTVCNNRYFCYIRKKHGGVKWSIPFFRKIPLETQEWEGYTVIQTLEPREVMSVYI